MNSLHILCNGTLHAGTPPPLLLGGGGGFTENPGGGVFQEKGERGRGCLRGIKGGGAETPFTVKTGPFTAKTPLPFPEWVAPLSDR